MRRPHVEMRSKKEVTVQSIDGQTFIPRPTKNLRYDDVPTPKIKVTRELSVWVGTRYLKIKLSIN